MPPAVAMLDHFEIMLLQDEYLKCVLFRINITGKVYYEDTSWYQLYGCMLISFHIRAL